MATNIIYKGEKVGTQVDFQTGSLTDISTFTGDVRGAAIENQIVDGVTDIGASQDAIHAMSGYLAANAHPTVTPAGDTGLDLSNGNVIQDISFAFDDDGHVTAASFASANLDDRYYTEGEVESISGVLNAKITGNEADISINATDIVTLSGLITGNDGDISTNATDIVTLSGLITGNDGDISTNATDIVTLSGLITGNDGDISTNATNIATNAANIATNTGDIATNAEEIDDLQAVSGNYLSLTLDDVAQNDGGTSAEVEVGSLRVAGDGTSASITGPTTITIDPDAEGADGLVVIAGDLQVDGTTTTINSTSVQIDDLNLLLGTGAPNNASADGAGIIVDGTGALTIAEFTYDGNNDRWTTNGTDIEADIIGTATGADAWTTARTITLDGDVTGAVTIDGGSNQTLTTTIEEGSVTNGMLENTSVAITGGAGLAGGGDATLGGSAVTLSISAGDGLTANTDSLDIDLDGSTLAVGAEGLKVNSITSSEISAGAVTSGSIAFNEIHASHLNDDIAGDNVTIADGVLSVADSDIQAGITGAASTIVADDLDVNLALASNAQGKVAVATTNLTELNHLTGVSSSVQDQLDAKALESITITGSNGLTGGGDLSANRTLTTVSDQGHLDEIELGASNETISNVVTKGGVLIVRATAENGLTLSGSADGNVIDLNDKTTVIFDGIIQSSDTDQPTDDGSYNAMWKVQGIIRRDNSGTTSLVQSFVTTVHLGSGASDQKLSVSADGNGLKIKVSDAITALQSNNIMAGTINYSWSEDISS
jgi:hypothetical protein